MHTVVGGGGSGNTLQNRTNWLSIVRTVQATEIIRRHEQIHGIILVQMELDMVHTYRGYSAKRALSAMRKHGG